MANRETFARARDTSASLSEAKGRPSPQNPLLALVDINKTLLTCLFIIIILILKRIQR